MTTVTRCLGLELLLIGARLCLGEEAAPAAPVVDSYAMECRVITLSRKDTIETQRSVARENARCRAAKQRQR